jgi:hypothetical protein
VDQEVLVARLVVRMEQKRRQEVLVLLGHLSQAMSVRLGESNYEGSLIEVQVMEDHGKGKELLETMMLQEIRGQWE